MTKIYNSSADQRNWKSLVHRFLLRGLDLLPSRELVIWDKCYSAVWKRDKFGGWLEGADRLPSVCLLYTSPSPRD